MKGDIKMYEFILRNTNLPKQDVKRIVAEATVKGWTWEKALEEAKKLYVKQGGVQ